MSAGRTGKALVFMLLVTLSGLANCEEDSARELYDIFREYRVGLSNLTEADPSQYFSRSMVDEMLGIVSKGSDASPELVLQVVRDQLLFGLEIDVVYSYELSAEESDARTLRIICSCSGFSTGYGAIEISFVNDELGDWKFNHLLYDTSLTSQPDEPEVVDRFSN